MVKGWPQSSATADPSRLKPFGMATFGGNGVIDPPVETCNHVPRIGRMLKADG
jgi:hypothetical protein